jgi:hypothetical protein
MLRYAALLLCAAIVVLPSSGAVLAQKAAPKQTAIPTDPNGLAAWCNTAVFRKYGDRHSTQWGPKFIAMPEPLHATMQDSCIRSKGRTF